MCAICMGAKEKEKKTLTVYAICYLKEENMTRRCCLRIKILSSYTFIEQRTNASFEDMPHNPLSTFHLSSNMIGASISMAKYS